MQHAPPSPKAVLPPSSPTARTGHLQPLDPGSTSMRSSLTSGQRSILAGKGGSGGMPRSNSDLSLVSSQGQNANNSSNNDADNIKVVVRVRPLFPHEEAKGAASVVDVAEDYSSVKVVVPGPGSATMQREFAFHACLGPGTSQAEVMQLCGIHQLLDAALAGYHVTILAYGQTGSGKTHTMSGVEDVISDDLYVGDARDGIVSRAAQYLFHQVNTRKDAKYGIKASYVEIYNEQVYDLIHWNPKQGKSLPVKWDASYGFYVQGLKVVPCGQMKTLMEVLRTGMKHRKVGSHQLNMESSRSHSIMTIYCDASPTDPSSYDYGTMRYGKLSFVDLAGSERVKDSHSEGTMLRETININKSLSALGKVISILAEREAGGPVAHVPYRDSKLTKLLQDSLGGNALTLMIACCSPSSLQVEETLSTLSYATRAKNIHNQPMVCYDPKEAQIALLRREIELLRQENSLLKEQLRGGPPRSPSLPHSPMGSPVSPGNMRAPSPHLSPLPAPALMSAGYHQGAGSSPLSGASFAGWAGPQQQQPGSGSSGGGAAEGGPGEAAARTPSADMRAVATRNGSRQGALSPVPSPSAGGSSSGSGMSQEALRRLRETQALLIRFSEENQRLARENDKLRGSKNVLGQEHANVLDEIDMLRGKLLQLEQSVRTAAVGGSGGGGSGGPAAEPGALAGAAAAAAVAAAGAKGGGSSSQSLVTDTGRIDVKALLASLGLGEAATADLPGVGVGPSNAWLTEAAEEGGDGSSSLNSSIRSSASRAGPLAAAAAEAIGGSKTSKAAAAAAAGGGGSPSSSARGLPVPPSAREGGGNADAAAAAAAGVSGRNTPVRQPSPLRPLMSPVRTGSSSSAATQLLGSTAGPRPGLLATGNVAAAAKTVIGRNAPLSATRVQPWADPPSDHKDNITVADAAKLAALFSAQAGAATAVAAAAAAEGKGGHAMDPMQQQQQQLARPGSLGALQRQPSLGAQKAVSFRTAPPGQ